MRRFFAIAALFCGMFPILNLSAEELPPATPSPNAEATTLSDTADSETGETDSTTTQAARLRDPFWPVGYVPSNPVPVKIDLATGQPTYAPTAIPDLPPPPPKIPQWDQARRQLKIQGISRVGLDKKTGRPTFFAVINGRVVEEGNIVEAVTPDFKYRWKVASIAEKNVKLTPLDVQGR